MAELPAPPNGDYFHRSIDQLRSMNDRGVLSSLSHLATADLRTAQLVHDYKPFNINEFRQNVERLDYSLKNGIVGLQQQQQNQQQQQQLVVDQHHQSHEQQQQLQQQQHQQQQRLKSSYSPPNSPQTSTNMSEQVEQKYDPNATELPHKPAQQHQSSASPENRDQVKPYKCTSCTKSFANSSYLSQHTRIHLGIKPYRCEICQRKFTQLSHLQQHIRTHTGDKPYKCRHTGCPKAFSQLSNLQSHSRCHQTDKPFKCNSCYKCFADELTLLEHIPKHKDSKHLKTHICNLCGKSYTQETYLQRHLQKHAEKAEKQQQRHANASSAVQHHVPAGGIGLNLQRQVMNAAAVAGDANAAYWAKVGVDSAVNAATLAEAIQQQQQAAAAQQQPTQNGGYNFAALQQQHQQQELLQHHQRLVNGSGTGGGDSAGSGNTPNHSQSPNDEGEDLVMRQTPHQQHLQPHQQAATTHLQQQTAHSPNTVVVVGGNAPVTTSAFTPLNVPPPHLNAAAATIAAQQRPPATTAAYLYQQNAAAAAGFPTQLISLHQIRNYAHQPGAASLIAGDHLLGLSVAASGTTKEKTQ